MSGRDHERVPRAGPTAGHEPIAIVGMGCRFPGSPHLGAFWDTILAGRICTGPVPRDRWNHDQFYSETGAREANRTYARALATIAEVSWFAPEFFGIAPRRAKVMDPQQRLFLDVVRMALEDAGYAVRKFPRERTGVFVGATVSDFMGIVTARMRAVQVMGGEFGARTALDEQARAAIMEDLVPMQAYTMVGSLMNMVAANVSQFFDFGGPSFTMDAACSSALVALHEAVWQLRTGLCEAAVVGGVYLILTPDNLVAFARIGALSPTDTCRPYDLRADGFFIGEGLGAVVLRPLDQALAAGDRIYAVIRGIASNSDGKAEGPMTPRREGQIVALENAYQDAAVSPRSLGVLEGHGTATPVGDATEIAAFRHCLGTIGPGGGCAVTSVKGNIGHTMSAAGIAGLIKAALCVRQGVIPPQAGYGVPRPELDLEAAGLYVPREARAWPRPSSHPRRAGVNAFGFGGTNVHVVLEESPPGRRARGPAAWSPGRGAAQAPRWENRGEGAPELIVLSAPSRTLLARAVDRLCVAIEGLDPAAPLGDLAYALALRRAEPCRLAVVARDLADLREQLGQVSAALGDQQVKHKAASNEAGLPQAVAFAEAPLPPEARRIALLFPGQGAQSPGPCFDLYRRFPRFRAELDRLAAAADALPRPLLSYLYPEGWPEVDLASAEAALTATEVCQPAVAAVGLALARFVRSLGVEPDVVLGHSLGEFAAAAAAGLIEDDAACVGFVGRRGRLIAELAGSPRGAMVALAADAGQAAKAIDGLAGVSIANLNHPRQVVISGTETAVAQVEARLERAGVPTTRLRVSHAFHSPLMAPIADRLTSLVRDLPLGPPEVPVISSIRPGPYPESPSDIRRIFLEHATSRVDFVAALGASAAAGAAVFVQVGAGSALAAMAGATLGGVTALTLAGSSSDGGATFLRALGRLFTLGAPVDLPALFDGADVEPLPMVPPSLLEERPLWPVAKRERRAEAEEAPAAAAPPEAVAVAEPLPGPVDDPVPAELGAARTGLEQPVDAVPSSSGTGSDDLERRVIEVVSRITAHPQEKLKSGTRLGADLGFDSLMVVELVSGLRELIPEAAPLPRDLFSEVLTIADVVRHLGRSLGSGQAARENEPPRSAQAGVAVSRYLVEMEPRPLAASRSVLHEPVIVLGDEGGTAEALRVRLGRTGIEARLVSGLPDYVPASATVVDLRGLSVPVEDGAPDATPAREALLGALALVRRLDGARPACLLFAARGLAAAALSGFAKSLAREWPEVRVVAPWFDERPDGAALAERTAARIQEELSSPDAACDVVHRDALRLAPVLRESPLRGGAGTALQGAAVVVAGGAAGLGARLAQELARRYSARLVLLGRRPHDQYVAGLLTAIARAGGQGVYLPCDVRDHAQVEFAIAGGRRAFGPIRFVVHAAGVIEDAPVARKADDAAARVFDTKLGGALALWRAVADDPVATFLIYGSWAGRFGSAHQTDYAAGNAAVGRLTACLAPARPGVRVVALDLPPWEGSGMLARVPDAIRREMRARGVPFLSDEVGLEHVIGELSAEGEPSGEVVLGPQLPARATAACVRTRLALASHPWLRDHRPNGRVVLPMAAAIDLMREAAQAAGIASGGEGPLVVRDLQVVRGVVLTQEKGEVVARASSGLGTSAATEIGAELFSVAARDGGSGPALAYRARFGVADAWLPLLPAAEGTRSSTLSLADFYGHKTFHGPLLRSVEEITVLGDTHVSGVISTRPATSDAAAWLLAIDGALQLCAYWAAAHHGRVGLPTAVAEMRCRNPLPAGAKLLCRARLRAGGGGRFEGDVDVATVAGEPLVQLRGLVAELFELGARPSPAPTCPVAELDPASYRIPEFPEVKELRGRIEFAAAAGLKVPYFRTLDVCTGATALIDGREHVNFTSYNYAGLSGDPRIAAAVAEAVERYGTSVSASRVTGGQKPIHAELEQAIAGFLGCEAALVMVGGHATNVSVIGHLLGPDDLVLHDSLAHDSILGGARLAGARRRPFAHNDPAALEVLLREVRPSVRRVLIAVEGVYSMDGDIAPLPAMVALKHRYGALLLVDEAHSLGVLGTTGRGAGEHFAGEIDRRDVDVWMGTMSKTLASCGGYVAGSATLVEYLKYTTPGFIYSVGITPANAAAALCALRLLEAEPERAARCQARARLFLELCRARGVDTGSSDRSAVVPCVVGNSYGCLRLAEALLERGIHVHPILYPAVAESMVRLRFFVTAEHTEEQLRATADALAAELAVIGISPHVGPPAPEGQVSPEG